ncbi:MAG TPA: AAA-like domain-containing protein [Thermoanaerobaculia bacterium]|nr:AAA-like domain-containing protein [Thermoanaerobaculia bacterium]
MICFDRDKEAARLWRYFKQGRNVLMLAPRRMGKTVLLERLKEESEGNGFRAIVLDVEGYRQQKDFFQQMCASIQEELGVGQAILASLTERLKRVVHGADNLQGDWRNLLLSMDWQLFADQLLAQLEEATDGMTWVFLVDEITIFTKALLDGAGVSTASDFLYKLRQLCREHPKVRWLFTGSIGLDTLARRHGFEGSLVDLEVFSLDPFSSETATDFLQQIARRNGLVLTEAAVLTMCERLGWLSPYYLEKIGEVACDSASGDKVVDSDAANLAADSLLDLAQRTYWSTWREHLDKNFPEPERTSLFTILAEAARSRHGASIDALVLTLNRPSGEPLVESSVRSYLDTLEADGYLKANPARSHFRFRMNLLREWWLRYVAPSPAGGSNGG